MLQPTVHNFEHASHVLLAVVKLLGRIVAPDDEKIESDKFLHDHTFGITSDPLVLFACAFSALIHDVEHAGVANSVLVAEGSPLAVRYRNRSVGEQNSVDAAFRILLLDDFKALRSAIYRTPEELVRFRQLVVNAVAATDVWDPQLASMRKERWNRAFNDAYSDYNKCLSQDDIDRKASTVLEHLITASDVSHCMQHKAIYLKWNECLFHEQFLAYQQGRCPKNHPAEYWYKGELWFFDNYIIPLAHKLENCGIFGVSSVEYLDYAMQNRREWEENGESHIQQYMENYHLRMGQKSSSFDIEIEI